MNLMFWKKKATTEASTEDSEDGLREKPGDQAASRKSPDDESPHQKASGDADDETADTSPTHPNRRLIISAVTGVLLLAAIGVTTWKILRPSPKPPQIPPQKQDSAAADNPALTQPTPSSEKPLIKLPPINFAHVIKTKTKDNPDDIEALKKKNDELQTQIEALRSESSEVDNTQSVSNQVDIEAMEALVALEKQDAKLQAEISLLKAELPLLEKAQAEQQQANIEALTKKNNEVQAEIEARKKKQASIASAKQAASKAQPRSIGGDVAVSNKDPKATAMTLKEIIKAMNAASGEPPKNPAK